MVRILGLEHVLSDLTHERAVKLLTKLGLLEVLPELFCR